MINMKFNEIIAANESLREISKGVKYKIAVVSNIITSFLTPILEYALRNEKINVYTINGEYDNIVQDATRLNQCDLVIIFWEASNLIDGLQYKIELFEEIEVNQLIDKVKSEIDLVFNSLNSTPLVIFNKFSATAFNFKNLKRNKLDVLVNSLNEYLETKVKTNIILIDTEKIFAAITIQKSIDYRLYYSSKALYTIDFFKEYVNYIKPVIMSITGRAKKALIFDCDNTLWNGILGEDGYDNIEMCSHSKNGKYFEEVQSIALALSASGVIIGICSKNNPDDVDEVINNHPDMLLRDNFLAIKKVNWQDKAKNIKEISSNLNIAEESIVFIDDSDFEINLIRENLPGVSAFQVPSKKHEYPNSMREVGRLFYNISASNEDKFRNEMYKQQNFRESLKSEYVNIDDYLRSMELRMTIYVDDLSTKSRVAQMSQKTNQFNLTTKRYSENDIENFIYQEDAHVFVIDVADKYGNYGLTGLAILVIDATLKLAVIDSLLMSCRVLGRNVELIFFDHIISFIQDKGIEEFSAEYVKTKKNLQVAEFYEKFGFKKTFESDEKKVLKLNLKDYIRNDINYINVNYGRKS
jgi:FkbH-like protein